MKKGRISPRQEAEYLVEIFPNQGVQLLNFLSGQLSVLKGQAQMLMGLCGLTITVTGFSGHHMVRGGTFPSVMLVAGIVFILVGIIITIRTMAMLRWVSQDLRDDLIDTAEIVIKRRNNQHRLLALAGIFVIMGLGCYLLSVAVAAFTNGTH